ncbi:MAG: ABC transporter ATP-binding protein [Clostridia bacterium]|nr:ABC transporter ATP-binding protein [Clostridia bacterium]
MIDTKNLTKDYGHGRGAFDITLSVPKGECFGFLGPNGAGKTTVIRHLLGFSRPQSGTAEIDGKDCYRCAAELQTRIGYLPGEIALPEGVTGTMFLNSLNKMRKTKDDGYTKVLLDRFELDPSQDTKRMSLGVKRKLAVVAAFLHDPDILILDEPTSGLDPIMQNKFIEFVKEEKQRGKTIFLSSHIFHEVDACCDRIAIIKDGRIVSTFSAEELKQTKEKIFRVTFKDMESFEKFTALSYNFTSKNRGKMRARVKLTNDKVNGLVAELSRLNVADFVEIPYTLEDYFMSFYEQDHHFAEVKA